MQMHYSLTVRSDDVNSLIADINKKDFIEFLGKKFCLGGYEIAWETPYLAQISLGLYPYKEPPKHKSEAELQLEQTIKLTQQDIEHKNRLIEQYEEKRAALEKQRLESV